ncbi:MAG TPA: hypothetical protein VNI01_00870 [Elusimicrobiota bacterium]|jgi:hypothetical protein|nr:hypothetical protein [Elusimicrobiota bacterium]
MRSALAFVLALAAAAPAAAQVALDDTSTTAGIKLRDVWTKVRETYPDALLTSISGRTDPAGKVHCFAEEPFQEGWRYSFYSPKEEVFLMMAECRGGIAGPLKQMRTSDAADPTQVAVHGRFNDSDAALRVLQEAGISLDPEAHKTGGRRPFTMVLKRLDDPHYAEHPVVWRVTVGNDNYVVDAVKSRVFGSPEAAASTTAPASNPGAPAAGSTAAGQGAIRRPPPPKGPISTAKKDLEKVETFVTHRFPGARLMGIEGFVDAWGGCPCLGRGDGWAYYYYHPKSKSYKSVFACNGKIGMGPTHNIPIDMNVHQPIQGVFIDSDKVLEAALVQRQQLMDESLGRKLSRHGELILVNFRASPFGSKGNWKTTLIWQLKIGTTYFKIDALEGKVLDVQE